jgi:hypothetical protein
VQFNQFIQDKMQVELSEWKAYKVIQKKMYTFWQKLRAGDKPLKQWLVELFERLVKVAQKERKKLKKHSYRPSPKTILPLSLTAMVITPTTPQPYLPSFTTLPPLPAR